MPKFIVTIEQMVQETCKVEIEAESQGEARAIMTDAIERNMHDEEYDLDWSDGSYIGGLRVIDVHSKIK